MDELEIQGRIYISSKRASELTGYAKDYIGQLAREGKIGGTRVGRAWYVDQEAILAIGGLPRSETQQIRPQTISSVHHLQTKKPDSLKTWDSIRYLQDSADLLPKILLREVSSKDTGENANKIIVNPGIRRGTPGLGHTKSSRFNDGIIPAQVKITPITLQSATIKSNHNLVLPLTIAAVAIVAIVVTGGSLSSEWDISRSSAAVTEFSGFDLTGPIFQYFSVLFDQGIGLIAIFISKIFSSFSKFFNTGLLYILDILNLG